jgi:hypothetical protein
MSEVTDFGGQNWLIIPAARAVNEAAPANISRQRWLLVLSGVAIVNMQGKTSDDWRRDEIHILPDMRGPLDFAINRYRIPRPQGTEGLNYEVGFQLRQWSPVAGLSSVFDQDQSVNAGFAVDGWRPSPFTFGTDAFSGRQVNGLFTGIIVSAAARDSDAWLYRVRYNITLTGRIVFCCGFPKFPAVDHWNSPGDERCGGPGMSLRGCQVPASCPVSPAMVAVTRAPSFSRAPIRCSM